MLINLLGMIAATTMEKVGAHKVSEVLMEGRFHRLLSLRFIPRGNDDPRVQIHLLSLFQRRQGSWLLARSITMTNMSAKVCGLLLKCFDT